MRYLLLALCLLAGNALAQTVTVAGPVYSVQMTDDAATAVQIGTVTAGKPCNAAQYVQTLGRTTPLYLIPKASVTLFAGISATAVFGTCTTVGASGTAKLEWVPPTQNDDGSPLTDLAGYTVYWGKTGVFNNAIRVNQPGATSYTVTGLTSGNWSFAVAAANTGNGLSKLSNTVTKLIP